MTIKLDHPDPRTNPGEKWRGCLLCGGSWSEVDSTTGQTNWYGRLYPESLMVNRDGKWFCRKHYEWRFRKKDMDKRLDIDEGDRSGPERGTI